MSDDTTPTPPTDAGGSLPGGVPTTPCPLQCPNMEIEVNNTSATNDDWVQLKCKLDCRARAIGNPPSDATVVLTNLDGRLRFPDDVDTTKTLILPRNGAWVPFQISGKIKSNAVGDAVIKAHCQSVTGPVVMTQNVTVVAVELDGLLHPNGNAVELPNINNLSPLPIADQIAHRTIKFKFTPLGITVGKTVQWTFAQSGMQGGVLTAGVVRGVFPAAHNTHLEMETGFNFDPATQQSTIDNNGNAAVRVNMPPIAFNKGRLKVHFVGRPGCVREVDFEVPGIVVIDPGHGGNANVGGSSSNNATSASGVLEKNMTLDFSRLVETALNASPHNIDVFMTRNADVNLGLAARANIARDNAADVFLSIHMNGFNGVAHGTTTHIRPNGNDQINYVEDQALATRIVNAVLVVNPVTNRAANVVDQGLGVLRDSSLGNTAAFHKTRACLLEVDFIDVPRVDVNLNTGPNAAANRQAICNAIRDAIINDMLNQP